jgi:hypothetical protein
MRANAGKKRPGFAPGPTITSSEVTFTARVFVTYFAIASRNTIVPEGEVYLGELKVSIFESTIIGTV